MSPEVTSPSNIGLKFANLVNSPSMKEGFETSLQHDMTIYGYISTKRKIMNDSTLSNLSSSLTNLRQYKKTKRDILVDSDDNDTGRNDGCNDKTHLLKDISEDMLARSISRDDVNLNDNTYLFGQPDDAKDRDESLCSIQSLVLKLVNEDSNEPKATSDNVANECLTEFGGKVNYCTNCNDNNVGTVQCEDCPNKPYLCGPCENAHRRVGLTKNHKLVKQKQEVLAPKEEFEKIKEWIDPYFVDGFSLCSSSRSSTSADYKESARLTRRLFISCSCLKSSEGLPTMIEMELQELASSVRQYMVNLLKADPCESVVAKACFIISQVVDRELVQAGYFVEDPIILNLKKHCGSNRCPGLVSAILLALRSITKEVDQLEAVFTIHKLQFLEREVRQVYNIYKESNDGILNLDKPKTTGNEAMPPIETLALDILDRLGKYH